MTWSPHGAGHQLAVQPDGVPGQRGVGVERAEHLGAVRVDVDVAAVAVGR